jgi:hypothetical protein
VAGMMSMGLPARQRPRSRSWSRFGIVVLVTVIVIALLIAALSHKQSQFPQAKDCPSPTTVNGSLGTDVVAPSAVSESDLLGCFYSEGSESQAVSVSFALYTPVDNPCRKGHSFDVSGDEACSVSAPSGSPPGGRSLVVETTKMQDQFSTAVRGVDLNRLETLAVAVLASPPPPLRKSPVEPSPGRGL